MNFIKTFKLGLMLGLLAVNLSFIESAYAAETKPAPVSIEVQSLPVETTGKTSKMTREKALYRLSDKYGFSEAELSQYVETVVDYKKMKELCLYARLSKKPLAEVVELSEIYPKGRLKILLGLNPQKLFDKTICTLF